LQGLFISGFISGLIMGFALFLFLAFCKLWPLSVNHDSSIKL
jgi:hypothetical protein